MDSLAIDLQLGISCDPRVQDLLRPVLIGARDEELARTARVAGVSQRNLKTLSLLYLPRLASSWVTEDAIADEIRRVSLLLRERGGFDSGSGTIDPVICDLSNLVFSEISEEEASSIIQRYHYLGSSRRNSTHFGLALRSTRGLQLRAVLSLSCYDLWHIPLPAGVDPNQVKVISRVFVFDPAPKNAVSFLIGRVTRWLRHHDRSTRLVLTYVNPAMGFSGSSYKAANFSLYGYEFGTRYCYVDRLYITDRELTARYGTSDPTELSAILGARFELVTGLPPLHIYCRAVDPRVKVNGKSKMFRRPSA